MSDRPPTHATEPATAGATGDGVLTLGPEGVVTGVSATLCELTGYAAEALVGLAASGLPLWPRFGAEGERLRAAVAAVLADGTPEGVAIALRRRDGGTVPVTVRLQPLGHGDGRAEGAVATVTASAGDDRALADAAPSLMRATGRDGGLTYANAAWLGFSGRRLADEIGDGWLAGVHPDDRAAVVDAQRTALAGGGPVEVEYRLRDATGTHRWVLDRLAARADRVTGACCGLVATAMDVTSGRRDRDRLRSAGEAMLDAFAVLQPVLDADGELADLRVLQINARAAAFVGRTVEEALGRTVGELAPARVLAGIVRDAATALGGAGPVRRETRSAVPGREDRVVEVEVRAIDGGEVALAWRDVTSRRRAEAHSAASAERHGRLAQEVPVAIFETDAEGRCTFVNRMWCELSGMSAEASLGLGWLEAIHPDDRRRVARRWNEALAAGTGCDQEYRLRRPDGSVRLIACRCVPNIPGDAAGGYLGTAGDITEERRAEREAAALRRIAIAVAEDAPASDVFARIAEEVARLLDAEVGLVDRFDVEGAVCVGGFDASGVPIAGTWPLDADNMASRIRRTGAPVRVVDLTNVGDPQVAAWAAGRALRAGVAAPVRVGGRLWGSVAAIATGPEGIPPRAEEQLDRFASLASLAIAHAEERERAVSETVADIFTGELDPQETLAAIITSSRRALRAERATCYLYTRAGTSVGELHSTETDPDRLRALRSAIGRSREELPLDRLLARHEPLLVIEDVRGHPAVPARLADAIGAGALIGIRLEHPSVRAMGGAQLGSLWLSFGAPRTFTPRDRLAARSLGAVAAIALANARLRAATDLTVAARSRGEVDELTGLPTHRILRERLAEQFERFRRAGGSIAVALFDLDHFSGVNERFGHRVGDDVLREAASRLAELAADGDLVARVGGEQFAWLMIGTGGADAWRAADRARQAIGAVGFPGAGQVTASVGVADLAQSADANELYRLASGALYWAKHHGRDVTFAYSPDVVEVLSAEEQAERLRHVQALQSIRVLARAVDAKDSSTRRHSERVADLAAAIATELGWEAERRDLLREAGLVHDVGKIGVPDAVLFKTGPLDAREYELITTHAVIGAEMVSDVLTQEQVAWVRHHHERLDGGGYPDGLAGDAVPDGARVLGLADAWDVMSSDRPYRERLGVDEALEECRRCAGSQFDPELVAVLERLVADGEVPLA